MGKKKLLGMTPEELQQVVLEVGLPKFTAGQIAQWMYKKRVKDIDDMTNISKAGREKLKENYELGVLQYVDVIQSVDGTKKYLFPVEIERPAPAARPAEAAPAEAAPAAPAARPAEAAAAEAAAAAPAAASRLERSAIEAVMIPDDDRATLCVSSQSGCKMGCRFCMTGRQGFHGNLSAADIISQFISVDESEQLTNTVFMGMGEPLDNYDNVMRAITVLTAEWGFGWSPKRITVSTIGVLPNLRRYLDECKCHLAVSLHNPFPEERASIMPVQKAWGEEDVLDLIKQYDFTGQRRVSFEYTMFSGFNDDKRHADRLVRLLKGLECRVNLIRFHRIPDFPYGCPAPAVMEAFRDRLNRQGVTTTIRASRGEDILAACGMLAGKHASSNSASSATASSKPAADKKTE